MNVSRLQMPEEVAAEHFAVLLYARGFQLTPGKTYPSLMTNNVRARDSFWRPLGN